MAGWLRSRKRKGKEQAADSRRDRPPLTAARPTRESPPRSGIGRSKEDLERVRSPRHRERPPAPKEPTRPTPVATPPWDCPTFGDVGGMTDEKQKIRDGVGMLLAFIDEAHARRIVFNGVLLHGPRGSGKTFLAQATAGEFGASFLQVDCADLVSLTNPVRFFTEVFDYARRNAPMLLLFDEFDQVAGPSDNPSRGQNARRFLSHLLSGLESVNDDHDVIVMAATDDLSQLDPAVVRARHFDLLIRVNFPDEDARAAIFRTQLKGRRLGPAVDFDELGRRSEGMSAGGISGLVNRCALETLVPGSEFFDHGLITQAALERAIKSSGGQDRPSVRDWSWDDVILPAETKQELQEITRLIEDPERARAFGIRAPAGAVLYGPPGTGKTMLAKVLAAEANASFYPIKGSDVISKWVGESEQNIAQLFARARENRPSIVFLDEIDAIAPSRDSGMSNPAMNRVVNQLLQEIDGMESLPGVFVLGATNRLDILDAAVLRGGRLGRQIEIGLPTVELRKLLFDLQTGDMPLADDVDTHTLALRTEGLSGGDVTELCQRAAIQAMIRSADHEEPRVRNADFEAALARNTGRGAR